MVDRSLNPSLVAARCEFAARSSEGERQHELDRAAICLRQQIHVAKMMLKHGLALAHAARSTGTSCNTAAAIDYFLQAKLEANKHDLMSKGVSEADAANNAWRQRNVD